MASISCDSTGNRRILFVARDGKRKTIRLGRIGRRDAEKIQGHVEHLLIAARLGRPMDSTTADWLNELDAIMAKRLAAVGLIPKREKPNPLALGQYLSEYRAKRIDVKPATREVWGVIVVNLTDFFGKDRELASITAGDAEDFKLHLIGQELAPTTVSKRLQTARQFFHAARKRKLIPENPFQEVSAKSVIQQDRFKFVTREETAAIMSSSNPTWRTIIGLSRFGGLRCPSEVLSLRWDNVNWAAEKITIHAPKTEHHSGKAYRTIPMFPELLTILLEAKELADAAAEYVVGGDYRQASLTPSGWRNCNLRTQFERIIKRAGLQTWPRLFHAMRASRETELAKEYPIHVVTDWLGHTPKIAMRHYLMTTAEDFAKATGQAEQAAEKSGAESGALAAQKAAQQVQAGTRREKQALPLSLVALGTYAHESDEMPVNAIMSSWGTRIRT